MTIKLEKRKYETKKYISYNIFYVNRIKYQLIYLYLNILIFELPMVHQY